MKIDLPGIEPEGNFELTQVVLLWLDQATGQWRIELKAISPIVLDADDQANALRQLADTVDMEATFAADSTEEPTPKNCIKCGHPVAWHSERMPWECELAECSCVRSLHD